MIALFFITSNVTEKLHSTNRTKHYRTVDRAPDRRRHLRTCTDKTDTLRSFKSIPVGAGLVAARKENPGGVATNYLMEEFPEELLKKALGMLPAYRCVSPVNRKWRDLYEVIQSSNKKKKKNNIYRYSISSEAAFHQCLVEEELKDRKDEFSYIGAGCRRTDGVDRGASLTNIRVRPLQRAKSFAF